MKSFPAMRMRKLFSTIRHIYQTFISFKQNNCVWANSLMVGSKNPAQKWAPITKIYFYSSSTVT